MARKWTSVYAHAHATSAIERGAGDSSRDPALYALASIEGLFRDGAGEKQVCSFLLVCL